MTIDNIIQHNKSFYIHNYAKLLLHKICFLFYLNVTRSHIQITATLPVMVKKKNMIIHFHIL